MVDERRGNLSERSMLHNRMEVYELCTGKSLARNKSGHTLH